MAEDRVLESFEASDQQRVINQRIRESVKSGLVPMLNVGYPEGKKLFYPKHQKTITMPKPGAVFHVPQEVASYLLQMPTSRKVQMVTGPKPANFTPPPGYKLVPVEPIEPEIDAEDLLEDKE